MVLAALLSAPFLTGCGPKPDIVSREPLPGDVYSPDEVRYITVDQPFALSGDYFRERNTPGKRAETPAAPGEFAAPPEAVPHAQRTLQQPRIQTTANRGVRPLPTAVPSKATPDEGEKRRRAALPVKLGLVVDDTAIPRDVSEMLTAGMTAAVAHFPAILARPDLVAEVMTGATCPERRDLACLSGALAVYPGVRMVILFEAFQMDDRSPGTIRARVSVVDTGILFRYPVMEVSAPLREGDAAATAVAAVCARLVDFAVKKGLLMPWYCRAFSNEAGEWYITAGRESGLAKGDLLRVVPEGRLVKSPTGMPAGWIPGPETGRLRVVQPFGVDFAVCELVDGEGPTPGHFLIPPGSGTDVPPSQ